MYARPFMNQIIHVTGAASGIGEEPRPLPL